MSLGLGADNDWRALAIRIRVARRVRELRTERGLTQEALAQRAGMHRPVIGRVERAKHALQVETLQRIANALEVSMKVFFVEVDVVNFWWARAQRREVA